MVPPSLAAQRPANLGFHFQPPPAVEVSPLNALAPTGQRERPEHVRPLVQTWTWKPWLALAVAGVCAVFLWNAQPASTQQASSAQAPDKGTTAVGDTSPTRPLAPAPHPKDKKPLAQESPPKLRPGQIRPDEKGRCPGRKQVPINGGCWLELPQMGGEECTENSFVPFKGKCYAPALPPPKEPQPTSEPNRASLSRNAAQSNNRPRPRLSRKRPIFPRRCR